MYELFEKISEAFFGNDRRADFEYLAKRYEFAFSDRVLYKDLDFDIKGLSIFQNKKKKTIRHFLSRMEDSIEGQTMLFDCHAYKDGERKSTTVLLFQSDCFNFPNFVLRPKSMMNKVGKLFFKEEPTFRTYPAFDDQYSVKGQRKETIAYVLCPNVAEILIPQHKLWMEGMGNYLAFYSRNQLADTRELTTFLSMGMDVCSAIINDDSNDYV